MFKKPKIFVGTLHSGEGDFTRCIDAINDQVDVDVTHWVINNLPEKEAHNALWSSWERCKSNHDLFVKVDADTVLISPTTLYEIASLFHDNVNVTGVQCPIHDYFSDSLINGLNCFSPVVQFRTTQDDLYCDRVDHGHNIVLRQERLPSTLVPAALHCHHASHMHAFHYGLHRKLKNQHDLMKKVAKAFKRHNDSIRGLALLGALAAQEFVGSACFNYTDKKFCDAFEKTMADYDSLIQNVNEEKSL